MFLLDWASHRSEPEPPASATLHRRGRIADRPWAAYLTTTSRLLGTTDGAVILLINGYLDARQSAPSETPLADLLQRCVAQGVAALEDLPGSYCLCLIDGLRDTVTFQRDPLGGRAAFVHLGSEHMLLSSHAEWIVRHPAVGFAENPDYLAQRLAYAGFADFSRSPFARITALAPGEQYHWQDGRQHSRQHLISVPRAFVDPGERLVTERFGEHLETALTGCTGQWDTVASLLSGGLDSAPATALAHRQMKQRGGRLHSISWSLPGHEGSDEEPWIRATTDHLDLVPDIFDGRDELPYAGLSPEQINPGWIEFNAFRNLLDACYQRAVAAGAEAVINSTAGDFIYPLPIHLPAGLWRVRDWSALRAMLGGRLNLWRRGRPWAWKDPLLRHSLRSLFSRPETRLCSPSRYRYRLLTPELRHNLPEPPDLPAAAFDHPVPDYPAFALAAMGSNRAWESGFAERLGLHYHDPYQHQALLQEMLALPFSYSYREGQTKWIMRRFARGLIPDSVLYKRRTGDLFPFLLKGYRQHRANIRERILDSDGWQHLLRVDLLEEMLDAEQPREADIVLINQLLGYVLWREYWSQPPPGPGGGCSV